MKIAFTNSSNRLVGGAERYIENIIGFLHSAGHETALWHETEIPHNRLPFGANLFEKQNCLDVLGLDRWLSTLKQWQPDVIFGHGLYDPGCEEQTLRVAPGVLFVHNYDRTCVSGTKCHSVPRVQACSRSFGPGCLLSFYPRRCGGLNPITLMKDYARVTSRLQVARMYRQVITLTDHIKEEYRKNGIACQATDGFCCVDDKPIVKRPSEISEAKQLLYIGRMVELKGGSTLLQALPRASRELSSPIHLRLIGDGSSRRAWEDQAAEIERSHPNIRIQFTGWLTGQAYEQMISDADLYILPSLWPEPFGMSGLELGLKGIPTVAFRIGGIPDWLKQGKNGILADYCPPYPERLADAISEALRNHAAHQKLRDGAREVAMRMSLEEHCRKIIQQLECASKGKQSW